MKAKQQAGMGRPGATHRNEMYPSPCAHSQQTEGALRTQMNTKEIVNATWIFLILRN